jgi:hypothetical protein
MNDATASWSDFRSVMQHLMFVVGSWAKPVVLEARACKWWMGQVLNEFCTVNHGVPEGVGQAVLDKAMCKHIRSKIEMVVSDSASNEVMAADIGRGRRLPQLAGGGDLPAGHGDLASGDNGNPSRDGDPLSDARNGLACLTPNLMIVGRDLAHGFRRNRPHKCVSKLCKHNVHMQDSTQCCAGSCNDHTMLILTWRPS